MTPQSLIIDGNAMGYAHHNGTTLTTGTFQTQAIYGFVRMLREMRVSFPGAAITVLWDGRAEQRFELLPSYKANREEKREDPQEAERYAAYKAQLPVIHKAVELLGVRQWLHPRREADDLAGYIVANIKKPKRLFTGDGDWLQLVDECTDWYDPRENGKLITLANFHERTGYFTPTEHLQGKLLRGDSGDNIPGIDGFGEKTALEFIAKWRSIAQFYKAVNNGTHKVATRKGKNAKTLHPEQHLASPQGIATVKRNLALMNLRNVQLDPKDIQVTAGAPRLDDLLTLFHRLGFPSLTKNFDQWAAPFAQATVLPLAA